jgi:lysophospholipase L1-like esterase
VHVGSIARSGVGSEALDLILERVLPRYPRLSAIVILVGASDVLRWLEEGAPDRPSTLVSTNELFRCHPEGPFGWTPGTLAITELAGRAHRRLRRPERVHVQGGRWLRKARAMRARAKVIRATFPDPGPMLRHFETCFRRAIERAQAHADRVIVVRQSWYAKPDPLTPEELAHMWHGGAGQAWREELTTYYSIDATARLMALMDASAVHVADESGVEHIDLFPTLESNLKTYYDYFHLTPSGAAAVAAVIARALEQPRGAAAGGEVSSCADLRAS